MKRILPKILLSTSIFLLSVNLGNIFAQELETEQRLVVSGKADETGNLSVTLTGDPGETLSEIVKVTNLGDTDLKIQTELQDFIVENENGIPTIVESGSTIWSMSKWIGVAEEFQEFTIEANESKDITFTIDIPQDATPGGHYTMILFKPVIVEEDVVGPLIENKVGNLIKLTVSGEVEESAEIVNFEAPYFSEYGPIPLNLKILNNGNTHVSVEGTVTIKNTIGNKVAEWEIKPANVFPTAIRLWETEWKGKWRFGIYYAEVNLNYGSANETLSSNIYFWIIPWKIVILILVIVISLIILGYYKNNKSEKKEIKKEVSKKKKSKLPSLN